MTHVEELLIRQAEWQRSRASMSWPEKIREAERARPALEAFRRMRIARAGTSAEQPPDVGGASARENPSPPRASDAR